MPPKGDLSRRRDCLGPCREHPDLQAMLGIAEGLDPTSLQEAEQYYREALGLARSCTGRKEREDCY
jgi:hypothetical protein